MPINLLEYNLIKIAALRPNLKVADVSKNTLNIIEYLEKHIDESISLFLTPELSLTGYSIGDLVFQNTLLQDVLNNLEKLKKFSSKLKATLVVGAPILKDSLIYNCAIVINNGSIKGIIPKSILPNNNEFYEQRWFASGLECTNQIIKIGSEEIPFGIDILFKFDDSLGAKFGIEICEDLWSFYPPSTDLSLAGAEIILNLSASNLVIGKHEYRKNLITSQSAKCLNAYVYISSGFGESSTDTAYSGYGTIAESGVILTETSINNNENDVLIAEVDVERLRADRIKNPSFKVQKPKIKYNEINLSSNSSYVVNTLYREISPTPFIPKENKEIENVCNEIFFILTSALRKRLEYVGTKNVVIGLSGGLDSTLALLVAVETINKIQNKKITLHALTMPGFGTSKRTLENATKLAKYFNCNFIKIDISDSVRNHLKDIGADITNHNITYENAQARERTQILMDYANEKNGVLIGTGDLSEAALGWCTFNGDHMSMYHVNSGVPKSLVRTLVNWYSDIVTSGNISSTLQDICNTPISPELIPTKNGKIYQKTEEILGDYFVHDFILYYFIRFGFSPKKIFLLLQLAFNKKIKNKDLINNIETFYKRFFSNQFKRSSMPDGVKIGTISLSPRADWRMPSDAEVSIWLKEIDVLRKF